MEPIINKIKGTIVSEQTIEIVERKGLGHPDFMADSLAEAYSRERSKYYQEKYQGAILHHNVDKLDIVGGNVQTKYGGGEFTKPILIFFSGRATSNVDNDKIPIENIAIESAQKWIKNNYRYLDPYDEKQVIYQIETKSGSVDLQEVFGRSADVEEGNIKANDTSIGIGYAPLTITERVVKELEEYMNSKEFKKKYPYSGEDIKIMGERYNKKLTLTIAMSMVDRHINNEEEYWNYKNEIMEHAKKWVAKQLERSEIQLDESSINLDHKVGNASNGKEGVYLNVGDKKKDCDCVICRSKIKKEDGSYIDVPAEKSSPYLVVSGASTEHGDDGAVGRGNRCHGLIPFQRPMSMEAVAGKNPVNHVGKLYNIMAFRIAEKIAEIGGVKEVYVKLLSQIGTPVTEPHRASADIFMDGDVETIKAEVKGIFESELTKDKFKELLDQFVKGEVNVC